MSFRLAVAEQANAGKVTLEEGRALITTKREALTQQALQLREELSAQDWVNDNRNAFKRVGCEFRVSGTAHCSDW